MKFRSLEISSTRFPSEGIRFATVKSVALRGRADLTVWTPPDHDGSPLPLVILLHGVYGSHWGWALHGGAHVTAGQMIENDEIPPVALVMPSDGLWGDGSGYIRQAGRHKGGDFEKWIVDEVPAAMGQIAPETADAPCFIAGLSMGGFGALRMGAKYPDRFAAISGHSSITEFEQLRLFVEESLDSYGVAPDDRSVIKTIRAQRYCLPPIRFDCGLNDPLLLQNRMLHEQLTAEEVPHIYEEFGGGHEWSYWEVHLRDTLRFFGERIEYLRNPPEPESEAHGDEVAAEDQSVE